jgi:hypothetical protein
MEVVMSRTRKIRRWRTHTEEASRADRPFRTSWRVDKREKADQARLKDMPPNASTAAGSASRLLYENDDVEHVPRFERQGAFASMAPSLVAREVFQLKRS